MNQTISILHDPSLDEWESKYCLCGKELVQCALFGLSCLLNKDKTKLR